MADAIDLGPLRELVGKAAPGPWVCEPDYDGDDLTGFNLRSKERQNSEICGREGFYSSSEADARLAALSPHVLILAEGLLACREALDAMKCMTGSRGSDDYVWGLQEMVDGMLRAVVKDASR